jgi:hypothetical protein
MSDGSGLRPEEPCEQRWMGRWSVYDKEIAGSVPA